MARIFTDEQEEFIRQNVKGKLNQTLADLVNQKFDLSVSASQVKTWKQRRRLSSGLRGSEGMDPPNKGSKGLFNVGGNRTSFKPGQRPLNYKPIGHGRIDRDGYLIVKVSDTGPWHKRWRHKHKLMWEEVNGPVPPGHALLFADQDKLNITLDNLILVTRAQLAVLNKNNLIQKDGDLNRTAIAVADLMSATRARKKLNEKGGADRGQSND